MDRGFGFGGPDATTIPDSDTRAAAAGIISSTSPAQRMTTASSRPPSSSPRLSTRPSATRAPPSLITRMALVRNIARRRRDSIKTTSISRLTILIGSPGQTGARTHVSQSFELKREAASGRAGYPERDVPRSTSGRTNPPGDGPSAISTIDSDICQSCRARERKAVASGSPRPHWTGPPAASLAEAEGRENAVENRVTHIDTQDFTGETKSKLQID